MGVLVVPARTNHSGVGGMAGLGAGDLGIWVRVASMNPLLFLCGLLMQPCAYGTLSQIRTFSKMSSLLDFGSCSPFWMTLQRPESGVCLVGKTFPHRVRQMCTHRELPSFRISFFWGGEGGRSGGWRLQLGESGGQGLHLD